MNKYGLIIFGYLQDRVTLIFRLHVIMQLCPKGVYDK